MMSEVTGKAISDTVSEYAELARDPTSAILKFNEAENFLTARIYERIRALQESGQIEEAAALATETRANAQIERAGQVVQSLGLSAARGMRSSARLLKHGMRRSITLPTWIVTLRKLQTRSATCGIRSRSAALQECSRRAKPCRHRGGGSAEQRAAEKAQKKLNSEAQRQLDSIIAGNRTKEAAARA